MKKALLTLSVLALAGIAFAQVRNIDVSKECPHYFVDANGKAFIPIGVNLVRIAPGKNAAESERNVKEYERWLDEFAANGGNWMRIWLSGGQFEVMPETAGVFDPKADAVIRRVVSRCERLGIRIKMTLVHHRSFFAKDSESAQPWANCTVYSPYVKWWKDFYLNDKCNEIFFARVEHLKSLGLDDSPAVACWEPCNEISASAFVNDYAPWSDMVLVRLQTMFPRQMVTQNLGSYSGPTAFFKYQQMAGVNANSFMQIHRYLDPGAQFDVCRGPMDVMAAESIREMLELRPDRPAVLAETGAVEANHAGPSALYSIDRQGVLMHDLVFAPFFAGSAASGMLWHWDCYIDRNHLWYHFGRFAKAIEGLDPIAEDFKPFRTETRRIRIYGLRGRKTTVVWCRDKDSDWRTELGQRIAPSIVHDERLPFDKTDFTYYLPWENRTVTSKEPVLPDFKRSIVARFPTDLQYAHIIEPH